MASSEDGLHERTARAAATFAAGAADLVSHGRWAEARELVARARDLGSELPDRLHRGAALSAAGSAVLIEWHTYGRDVEYRALVDTLRSARERNELRAEHAPALYAIGSVQTRRGEFVAASTTLALARSVVDDGSPFALPIRAELALARQRAGHWADAWATVEAAQADIVPDPDDARSHALLAALRLLRPAFEFDTASITAVAPTARLALERGWTPLADAIVHHAQTCMILASMTWDDLLRSSREVESRGYRPLHLPGERRTLEVLALANQPDRAGLRALVEKWGKTSGAAKSPYYWIARALVAEDDDDDATVKAAVELASIHLTGDEDPLGYAHVLMTTGNIIARRVSPAEGMAWWARAREGLAHIGASSFVELCNRVIERRARSIAESSVNPLTTLTGQQRLVVAQVASGHTSAEIARTLNLSRKTIDFHVANALTKLGLSSRRELRAVWDRWSVQS